MPTFNSQQLLTDLLQQTENVLNTVITQWQKLPQQTLLYKQNTTAWSAVQCLMHLNSYGNYYLPQLKKSIEEAKEKRRFSQVSFSTSYIGNWFTELMLPKGEGNTIKKMKSPKNHEPVLNESGDAVISDFINQQKIMWQILEEARNIDLRKAKTPVSISRFIRLPLGDTFRFLVAHTYRHLLQAERALTAAEKEVANV